MITHFIALANENHCLLSQW